MNDDDVAIALAIAGLSQRLGDKCIMNMICEHCGYIIGNGRCCPYCDYVTCPSCEERYPKTVYGRPNEHHCNPRAWRCPDCGLSFDYQHHLQHHWCDESLRKIKKGFDSLPDPNKTVIAQFVKANKTVIAQFLRRVKAGREQKKRNESLPAGSPMYFYCDYCDIQCDFLPEDYFFPPYKICSQCRGIKEFSPNLLSDCLKRKNAV